MTKSGIGAVFGCSEASEKVVETGASGDANGTYIDKGATDGADCFDGGLQVGLRVI